MLELLLSLNWFCMFLNQLRSLYQAMWVFSILLIDVMIASLMPENFITMFKFGNQVDWVSLFPFTYCYSYARHFPFPCNCVNNDSYSVLYSVFYKIWGPTLGYVLCGILCPWHCVFICPFFHQCSVIFYSISPLHVVFNSHKASHFFHKYECNCTHIGVWIFSAERQKCS